MVVLKEKNGVIVCLSFASTHHILFSDGLKEYGAIIDVIVCKLFNTYLVSYKMGVSFLLNDQSFEILLNNPI